MMSSNEVDVNCCDCIEVEILINSPPVRPSPPPPAPPFSPPLRLSVPLPTSLLPFQRHWISTWRQHARTIVEEREAYEKKGKMRQDMLERSWAEAKAEEDEAKRLWAEEEAARLAEEERVRREQEEYAHWWEQQKTASYEKGENRKKMEIQEKVWKAEKEEAKREEAAEKEVMWRLIEDNAAERAKEEAMDYLLTAEGQKVLDWEVKKLRMGNTTKMEDGDNGGMDGDWVKMYDEEIHEVFYYNTKTGGRVTADTMSLEEARALARKAWIDQFMMQAREDVKDLEAEKIRNELEYKSAFILQGIARCHIARKNLRLRCRKVILKRCVPTSTDLTQVYYYDTRLSDGRPKWTKPLVLGPDEDIHLDEWVYLVDEAGTPYYQQTINPRNTLWEKPVGYVLCMQCNVEFGRRKCRGCIWIYCFECFAIAHKRGLKEHSWKPMTVRPQFCILCKKTMAIKMCSQCDFDPYCAHCFELFHYHGSKKISTDREEHKDFVFLE